MNVKIDCVCPRKADGSKRHDQDTITLRDKLGFHEATSIRNQLKFMKSDDPDISHGEILAAMTEHYLIFGVETWTLVDDKGKRVPVSRAAIREFLEFIDFESAMTLTDAADDLYAPLVLLPLAARASRSLPPTPTDGSIFQRNGSSPKPRKPSKPSSTTTSLMADTAPITVSLDGDSSFWPSAKSAP
jgi:hypothetical protein